MPPDDELPERLGGVLHVIHLVYTEGHVATAGDDLVRADLCEEAIRLARLVVELVPDEPEAARPARPAAAHRRPAAARTDADGTPVSLEDQDRSRWDRDTIAEGTAVLDHALARGAPGPVPGAGRGRGAARRGAVVGRHRLAPDRRPLRGDGAADPSPVVTLNRAVALGLADGPHVGLAVLATLDGDDGSTATSRSTRRGPSSWPEPATRRRRRRLPQGDRAHAERRRATRPRGAGGARRRSAPRIGLIIPCRPVTIAGCRRSTGSPSGAASTR